MIVFKPLHNLAPLTCSSTMTNYLLHGGVTFVKSCITKTLNKKESQNHTEWRVWASELWKTKSTSVADQPSVANVAILFFFISFCKFLFLLHINLVWCLCFTVTSVLCGVVFFKQNTVLAAIIILDTEVLSQQPSSTLRNLQKTRSPSRVHSVTTYNNNNFIPNIVSSPGIGAYDVFQSKCCFRGGEVWGGGQCFAGNKRISMDFDSTKIVFSKSVLSLPNPLTYTRWEENVALNCMVHSSTCPTADTDAAPKPKSDPATGSLTSVSRRLLHYSRPGLTASRTKQRDSEKRQKG